MWGWKGGGGQNGVRGGRPMGGPAEGEGGARNHDLGWTLTLAWSDPTRATWVRAKDFASPDPSCFIVVVGVYPGVREEYPFTLR